MQSHVSVLERVPRDDVIIKPDRNASDTPPTQRTLFADNVDDTGAIRKGQCRVLTVQTAKQPVITTYATCKRKFTNWKSRSNNRANELNFYTIRTFPK